jgi:transposase
MNRDEGSVRQVTERHLEREYREIEAAIELVRSGGASVVSVTGLQFGEAVLHRIHAAGGDWGVTVDPQWWPDDSGCDIVIRAPDAARRTDR